MLRVAAAAAIALGISGPVLSQQLYVYSSDKQLQYFSKDRLEGSAAEAFSEFKKSGYYSAFAYNSETGSSGYHRAVHSLAYAQEAAMRICRHFSDKNPDSCKMYAQIVPKGYKHKSSSQTLSQSASEAYLGEFQSYFGNEATKHFVFAIAPEGAWSWRTRDAGTSFSETKRKTLEACRSRSAEDRQDDVTWWTETLGTNADYKCKVVFSKTR